MNLVGYLNHTFVTRENELTQSVASTKVYAQMDIPSGTTVDWYASNDDGETWEAMTLDATREIDSERTEHAFSHTFAVRTAAGCATRPNLPMTASSILASIPWARRLAERRRTDVHPTPGRPDRAHPIAHRKTQGRAT